MRELLEASPGPAGSAGGGGRGGHPSACTPTTLPTQGVRLLPSQGVEPPISRSRGQLGATSATRGHISHTECLRWASRVLEMGGEGGAEEPGHSTAAGAAGSADATRGDEARPRARRHLPGLDETPRDARGDAVEVGEAEAAGEGGR